MRVKFIITKTFMNKGKEAIIIGSGITGLTTALYLKRKGWKVTILEKNGRYGGSIQSFVENGFIYERGPNTGMVTNQEVKELFISLQNKFEYELAKDVAQKRLIWQKGRWHILPSKLATIYSSPLFSIKDKANLLLEPIRKKGNNPNETLGQLFERRLGKSFLNYALYPFVLGIFSGDPSQLITKYTVPKLYNMEQEKGNIAKEGLKKLFSNKEKKEEITDEMFSVKGGLEKLIDAMVSEISEENIILNAKEITVYPKNNQYKISYIINGDEKEITAPKIISTTNAGEIPTIFPFLNQKEKEKIGNLTYSKVVQASVGFAKWRGISIKAFGALVPATENKKISGVLFPSSFLSNRAPKNGALLSVFLGGNKFPDIISYSDDEIKEIIMEELRQMFILPKDCQPNLFKVFRHQYAIPQYEASTEERLKTIEKIENEFPGIILGGNIRDGFALAERIKQGVKIAKALS